MKRRVQSYGLASVLLLGVLTLAGCPDDGAIDGGVLGHKTTSKGVSVSVASPSPTPTASASGGTSNTSITSGIDASAPPASLPTLPPTAPSPAPTPVGAAGQPIYVPNAPSAIAFLRNLIAPLVVRAADVVQLDNNNQQAASYGPGGYLPTLIAVDGANPYSEFWVVAQGGSRPRADHLKSDPLGGLSSVASYPLDFTGNGLAVDATEAWISHGSGAVTRLDKSSGATTSFTVSGPTAVALQSSDGWVTGLPNKLYKVSRSSAASSSYTVGSHPIAVAVDRLGNVWTANQGDQTVSYLATGASTAASRAVAGTPTALAIDTDRVWVGMSSPSQVAYFALDGTLQGTASLPITPSALALDALGNIWAADPTRNSLVVIQGR